MSPPKKEIVKSAHTDLVPLPVAGALPLVLAVTTILALRILYVDKRLSG